MPKATYTPAKDWDRRTASSRNILRPRYNDGLQSISPLYRFVLRVSHKLSERLFVELQRSTVVEISERLALYGGQKILVQAHSGDRAARASSHVVVHHPSREHLHLAASFML